MWPTIYIVEDIADHIKHAKDLLMDLKWLQPEPAVDYARPWRISSEELSPSNSLKELLKQTNWSMIENRIVELEIKTLQHYKYAFEALNSPSPGSYLLLDLNYETAANFSDIIDEAKKYKADVNNGLWANFIEQARPGILLGTLFLKAQNMRCVMTSMAGNPEILAQFYPERVRSALPLSQDSVQKTILVLLEWIAESCDPISILREARNTAWHQDKSGWIVNAIQVKHKATNVNANQCKAIRKILGLVPYETNDTGNLTPLSELFHDGIKAISDPEASTLKLTTVMAIVAIVFAQSGKTLSLAQLAAKEKTDCGIGDFQNLQKSVMKNQAGDAISVKTNNLDFAKTLYEFFKEIMVHEGDGNEILLPNCLLVEEDIGSGFFVGIKFTFKEWPSRKDNGLPLADCVLWHVLTNSVKGQFADRHMTSMKLSQCICEGGWGVESDINGENRLLFLPYGAKTIVRFVSNGLQFLVKKGNSR